MRLCRLRATSGVLARLATASRRITCGMALQASVVWFLVPGGGAGTDVAGRIFISYSRQRPQPTRDVAAYLTSEGYSVWWDTKLISGDIFREVIVRELDAAERGLLAERRRRARDHVQRPNGEASRRKACSSETIAVPLPSPPWRWLGPRHPQGQAPVRQFFWTKQVPPADLSVSHSWSASLFTPYGPSCAA
jgi:hypothetical protein